MLPLKMAMKYTELEIFLCNIINYLIACIIKAMLKKILTFLHKLDLITNKIMQSFLNKSLYVACDNRKKLINLFKFICSETDGYFY